MPGKFLFLRQGRGQRIGGENLGEAEYRIERGAQFMAHRGQERRLGMVGFLGRFHGQFQVSVGQRQLHGAFLDALLQPFIEAHDFRLGLGDGAVGGFQRAGALFDFGQHGVERVHQLARLVVADAAGALGIVARIDHFAGNLGNRHDRLGDDMPQPARDQPGDQHGAGNHPGGDGQVIEGARGQCIFGAQIHRADGFAMLDDRPVEHQVATERAGDAGFRMRRRQANRARRQIRRKHVAGGVVDGGGMHAGADA